MKKEDKLKQYSKKRNLKKSGEPKPILKKSKKKIRRDPNLKEGSAVGNLGVLRFVVHDHHASHHHWDLRLEMNSVLKSWAIPKSPPTKKGIKRLAIAVEDHPLSYTDFEGTIPEGNYGAGKVEIWDNGTYELIDAEGDPFGKKNKEKIEFKLNGKKLKGNFVLVKTNYGSKPEKSWLWMKV
jgi:DNA ligase D-like protein (predicted 3'-phosphoesterase)